MAKSNQQSTKKAPAKTKAAAAQAAKEEAQPKLIWRGKGEPPTKVRIGLDAWELPDEAAQRAGFEHEAAQRIARAVAGFKLLKDKGAK